ncbi:MAG: hypothetical protein WD448_09445 [Woeseia sp.]
MRFSASAPGKAVLAGEYAVLRGAPAIAMAVDCRARVTVESNAADWHSVVSPGQERRQSDFRCAERGAIEWLEDGGAHSDQDLLEHVWHQVRAMPAESLKLTLDTRHFYDSESNLKLGFGSSSALATALTAALVRAGAAKVAAGAPRDMLEMATAAHRNFQNGQGSGIDVATAVQGGVIGFNMRGEQRVQTLQWPAGLDFWLLWSGRPASTVDRLRKLEHFRQNRATRDSAAKLIDASRDVHDAWQRSGHHRIVATLRSYNSALRHFSEEHALGIFDAGHQELSEMAEAGQLIYKPCGAGGGDVGILFIPRGTSGGVLDNFAQAARQLGFRRLDRTLELAGLNYEH